MNDIPFISIIIVTYGALDYIKRCVWSIGINTPKIPYELIFIDNNSGKEVTDYLTSLEFRGSNVKVIYNGENRLLTPAQNQGIKKMDPKSKAALFIMPDSIVLRSDWLELLIDGLKYDFIGIVGPVFNHHPIKPLCGNIDMSCLLVTKNVLDKVGSLDEDYLLDGGGLALTLAAYTKGFLSSHLKRPKIVYHYGGVSRALNLTERQKVNIWEVYEKYGIKPKLSIWGLIRQVFCKR